jgi:hypothetical protein
MFNFVEKVSPKFEFEDPTMQKAYEHGMKQGHARAEMQQAIFTGIGAFVSLCAAGFIAHKINKVNKEMAELSSEAQFKKLLEDDLEGLG